MVEDERASSGRARGPSVNTMARFLEAVVSRVERLTVLDKVAGGTAAVLRRVIPSGPVRDIASGTPIGHPAHPLLVAIPIGSFIGASYLDVAAGPRGRATARTLVGLGLVSALPAAYAGASDWVDTAGGEQRVGLVHAACNTAALSLYLASWLARRRQSHLAGAGLALAGGTFLAAGGWLGGHLSYAMGVGVDTTAFQQFPKEWTDVAASDELRAGEPTQARVGDAAVFLLRGGGGDLVALADRCSHRGGPLHEGELGDGCITCPWHGSAFDLRDGSVRRGPASRPQPVLEIRERDGRIEVRRSQEQHSLRVNPA